MFKKSLRSSPTDVNSKTQSDSQPHQETVIATQLVPVLLRRGDSETFYHVPTCGICRKPILDFEQANVVVVGFEYEPLENLGTVDGAEMFRLPGTAIAVHFDCDKDGFKPWVRATSVFCRDQRGPIEKLGWRVGR